MTRYMLSVHSVKGEARQPVTDSPWLVSFPPC
jgi:hypothetical protein